MTILRLAAVQLHFHPAFEGGGHQALREPTGAWEDAELSGLRAGTAEGDALLEQLRERIEHVYLEAYWPRLEAVVRFAAGLGLDLLVLPEYAVPLALLPLVAAAAGSKLTVVAGTHTVTREGVKRGGIYEQLGAGLKSADIGRAVAPVLRGGKMIAAQPKISRSKLEPGLKVGEAWSTVPLRGAEMGILVCLDFLERAGGNVAPLITWGFDACAVLAVPSLEPFAALPHVVRSAEEHLDGCDRPVVYASSAAEGGTRVLTFEQDAPVVLGAGRAPALPPGIEGVVAVEVHLGEEKVQYRALAPSRPLAAAVVMDAGAWGELREAAATLLAARDPEEARLRIAAARGVFAQAAASADLPEIARARWRYLASEAVETASLEHLHALARDVWVEGVSAHREVERGLVEGAARVLREVEKRAPEAQELVTFRERLEGEVLYRYTAVAAAGKVVERVTEGLLQEPGSRTLQARAQDGSFERWVRDPGPLPLAWSKRDFREWLRTTTGTYSNKYQSIHDSSSRVWVVDKEFSEIVAGLLTLLGHQPAWMAHSRAGDTIVILPDGHAMVCLLSMPVEGSLREMDASSGGLPRALVRGVSSGRLTALELDAVPAGVWLISDEIRKLAWHPWHSRYLAQFLASDEHGRWIEPLARLRGGGSKPLMAHLQDWRDSRSSDLCLLLGEFGTGKSTAARVFAALSLTRTADIAPVIFVDLRAWSGAVELPALVRSALGVEDVAPYRFAVEEGECTLILDGFDEISNRLIDLAGALRSLLVWRTKRSKILLTCRTHLFVDPGGTDVVFAEGRSAPLRTPSVGEIKGVTVLELQLFDEERIQSYLARVTSEPQRIWEAMGKVDYLRSLAERPMLLDIIRQTLPTLTGSGSMALGDLYEMYMQRWVDWPGPDDWLDSPQKITFAEELAFAVWNDGPEVEAGAVRAAHLSGALFRKQPLDWSGRLDSDAVRLALRAGTFIVWREGVGLGHYHFAHRSFLEYMLARRTVREVAEGNRDALDLPRFSPEVIGYCKARPGWKAALRAAAAILVEPYRKRVSENALLLVLGEKGMASSVERPWRLEGADLQRMRLSSARLAGAWLEKADLTGADLVDASLREARLDGAVLDGADLGQANLCHAGLRGATAREAILDGTRFEQADLRNAKLEGSSAFAESPVLQGARLEGARITGAAWVEPAPGTQLCGLVDVEEARWRSRAEADLAAGDQAGSRLELAWHHGGVTGVAFSPNGNRFATACEDRVVRIWETRTGWLLQMLRGHTDRVTSVAWTANGERLATLSSDRTARVWEVKTGRLLHSLQGDTSRVTSVAWTADGERLATGSGEGTARVWEVSTGRLLQTLQHRDRVNSAAWTADGERLATGSGEGKVRVWEVSTGRLLQTLPHLGEVTSVAWTADGERLATGSDDRIARVWDAGTGRLLQTLQGHRRVVTSVAWTADGERLATGSYDMTARLWDARTGRLLQKFEGHPSSITSVRLSPDAERLATVACDATVRVWEARTGRPVQTLQDHTCRVTLVAWTADGERLATGSDDGIARVWEASTGKLLQTLQDHRGGVTSVAWTANGEHLATTRVGDAIVRVWEAKTGSLVERLYTGGVKAVAWTADGERLATLSSDKVALIWAARTGWQVQALEGHGGAMTSVAWTADGERLATGSDDRTAWVWSVKTGQPLQTLEGHTEGVTSVAWTADGERLATGSHDRTARVWEASTGRLLQTLEGHTGGVTSVAWTADGERLATGSDDRTARVWEASTGRLLQTLVGHTEVVTSVAWAADGERLATGSEDATARVWSGSTAQELATFVHMPSGGVAIHGVHVVSTGTVDLSKLVVRTGTQCAPLALYADLCLRPDLVAEALAGSPAPALHVPMDTAARSIVASAHEVLVPHALGAFNPIKAGSATTLQAPWSIPEGLHRLHGFRLSLKALLPAPFEVPVDPRCPTIDLPALPPGTHQLLLTLHLGDRYERSFTFPLTVLAQSPYVAGPPVRGAKLLGREADLARIRARLKNGSIRLAGERRIGKTSILHHFFDHPGPGFVPVWLDAQTLDDDASFRDWILSSLHERFPSAPASPGDLFAFLRAGAEEGRTPLLLIDEIVHLRGLTARDAGLLRSLSVTPFASILAGSPTDWAQFFAALPHDAGSPFNTLQDVFLGPLTETQMRVLILQPGIAPPDDETMLRILELCGGRPYLAQRLCEAALDRTYAEGRMRMSLADIEAVARETLVTSLAHQHEKRWRELAGNPAAQAAVVDCARGGAPAPRALHDTLREHGLFDGLEWTVDPAFMMWIRERETT